MVADEQGRLGQLPFSEPELPGVYQVLKTADAESVLDGQAKTTFGPDRLQASNDWVTYNEKLAATRIAARRFGLRAGPPWS